MIASGFSAAARAMKSQAAVPGQVAAVRAHEPGLRVGPQEFVPELLEQVVFHHEDRFADQAEALLLHRADDLLEGLPGAHVVAEQRGRLVDHPGDGGFLPPEQGDARVHAGQGQLHVVVGAQDDRVECVVIAAADLAGAVQVLPHPAGEPVRQLGLLLPGGQGGFLIDDGLVLDGAGDLDRGAAVEEVLGQVQGVLVVGAPGDGGGDAFAVAAGHIPFPALANRTVTDVSMRVSRRNCSTSAGAMKTAPSRAEMSAGPRSAGITSSRAVTLPW